jgi:predicted nucleic acid-binding protein
MEIFHVVFDTSVLTHAHFKTGQFEKLLRLVKRGVVKLYVPDVVLEERRTQLLFDYNRYADEVRALLVKMGRSPLSTLLEGLPLPAAVDLPSRDEVNRNSRAVFLQYLEDNHVEVLPFTLDHATRAMERYMHGLPPFKPAKDREPERKHIPDSWILEAALDLKMRPGRHCMLVKDGRFSMALKDVGGFEIFTEVDLLEAEVLASTAVVPIAGGEAAVEADDVLHAIAHVGTDHAVTPLERLRTEAFKDFDIIVIGINEALGNPEKGSLFTQLERVGIDRSKAELMARMLELSGALIDTGSRLIPTDAKLANQLATEPQVQELLLRML